MMKLVLQIALGVFLGALASQLTIDAWRAYENRKVNQSIARMRANQETVLRRLFSRGGPGENLQRNAPPPNVIPDDVQQQMSQDQSANQ